MAAFFKVKKDPLRTIKKLKDSVQKKLLKRALRKAVKPLVATAKSLVPVRTRALMSAITSKVDSARKSTVTYGIVGIKSKFRKYNKQPSRYGHLVEFGSYKMAPQKFLEPTLARHEEQFFATVKDEVAKELAAL
jgi:HK97 gp10 family phage protein